MAFEPQQLLSQLDSAPEVTGYCVALSGGLDSSVLLHAMHALSGQLSCPLRAIHIDHQLHPESPGWRRHCRDVCRELAVAFESVEVEVVPDGLGIEAAARLARYRALEERIGEGEALLTAHHLDDQAETLLLQLFRGGGVRGLAAMPPWRPFAKGLLLRPLLETSREELLEYARRHNLGWVDDPSNASLSLERNHIRHSLLPQLVERYPSLERVLSRSARHFGEASRLLDELAELDGEGVVTPYATLGIEGLMRLSPPRRRNLLRHWIRACGYIAPDAGHLERILNEVVTAGGDRQPLVAWSGCEVRRFHDGLYLIDPLPTLPGRGSEMEWDCRGRLPLPGGGTLSPSPVPGAGVARRYTSKRVVITLRSGGERIQLAGREGSRSLKKLFQEAQIPPWLRPRWPLVTIDGELAQVAGLWSDARFAAVEGEEGIIFRWSLDPFADTRS